MIYFTRTFQLKGLKPKNKGYMNFYECCDSTKKYILGPLDSMFLHSISDFIVSFFLHLPWHYLFMNHDIKSYKLQKYIMRRSKNINNAELFCIELYTRKTGENLLQKKNIGFFINSMLTMKMCMRCRLFHFMVL